MDEPVSVEPKPWDVLVVDKVLALEVQDVAFIPISPNSQNFACALLDSHNVWQRYASQSALLVGIFMPGQVQIDMHLKDAIAVVLDRRHASLLGLLLLNVVQLIRGVAQVHVHVEPSLNQLGHLVLGLTHDVRDPLGSLQVTRAVGHNDVFSGDKHRHLASLAWVVVDLLERTARNGQVPKHLLVLGAVLIHHVGQLIVHVFTNSRCRLLHLGSVFAQNDSLHRPSGWERLGDTLALEPNHALSQHGVEHTTRPLPRLGAVLVLQAQQF